MLWHKNLQINGLNKLLSCILTMAIILYSWFNWKFSCSENNIFFYFVHISYDYISNSDTQCPLKALLAARNSAAVVFTGTFGALAYVTLFTHGDLDALYHDWTLYHNKDSFRYHTIISCGTWENQTNSLMSIYLGE